MNPVQKTRLAGWVDDRPWQSIGHLSKQLEANSRSVRKAKADVIAHKVNAGAGQAGMEPDVLGDFTEDEGPAC